jgi:MFS family permease
MGTILGAGLGLLTSNAPPERRGQIASAYFLVAYIGLVVPVVGFGLLENATSLVTAGLILSVLVGIVALMSGAAIHRSRAPHPTPG